MDPEAPSLTTLGPLPGESDQAFAAFTVYRDMGMSRSLAKCSRKLGKSKTLCERWSRRWGWARRVAEFDQEMADIKRVAVVQAIESAVDRHSKLAKAMLGRVAAELNAQTKGRCQACGRGREALTPQQVARWLRVAVDVERVSLGLGGTQGGNTTINNVVAGDITVNNVQTNVSNLVVLRDKETQALAGALLARMSAVSSQAALRRVVPGHGERDPGRKGLVGEVGQRGPDLDGPRPESVEARELEAAKAAAAALRAREQALLGKRVDPLEVVTAIEQGDPPAVDVLPLPAPQARSPEEELGLADGPELEPLARELAEEQERIQHAHASRERKREERALKPPYTSEERSRNSRKAARQRREARERLEGEGDLF